MLREKKDNLEDVCHRRVERNSEQGGPVCVRKLIGLRKTKCIFSHDRKTSGRVMILEECHGNGNPV